MKKKLCCVIPAFSVDETQKQKTISRGMTYGWKKLQKWTKWRRFKIIFEFYLKFCRFWSDKIQFLSDQKTE